ALLAGEVLGGEEAPVEEERAHPPVVVHQRLGRLQRLRGGAAQRLSGRSSGRIDCHGVLLRRRGSSQKGQTAPIHRARAAEVSENGRESLSTSTTPLRLGRVSVPPPGLGRVSVPAWVPMTTRARNTHAGSRTWWSTSSLSISSEVGMKVLAHSCASSSARLPRQASKILARSAARRVPRLGSEVSGKVSDGGTAGGAVPVGRGTSFSS